ncbi:uncharacterized protein LTR77_000979 [Saxophila tyrrhenica]|uniref:PRISE-like Rossmann-fold domain-containing protein n=1 Tax=Saxophila tyrrhenica TaxID=1690608 RepID=A0AAV9PS31_9PEZI|nr:hypothetical protein LTR77_000979 [Saxophila tyrrhenica]
MPPPSQVVKNEGIYHGMPTYPDEEQFKNLTAVVTGANGISGYHMVKVLAAAPQRWSKIYCLSRRPPPDYFFDGLGDGAKRVEHVEADFLGSPEQLAEMMKGKIGKVDHVFFFSYTQPQQKGGLLGMWSDADALAKVNCTFLLFTPTPSTPLTTSPADLISNFTRGLQLANLTPKRFLLQTGAKHYGFHIGPATCPSFETDPRVLLENNFYYPQEDILSKYCAENGVGWNVVRPSYIIGAVRDNLLNHMVGFAIYASVQAHLKQPLAFPGDYSAWDREMCQSTAMVNAYLEEWAVLTPDAENEAFNAQDGLPFTWGRFWAHLASWYGVEWTPPETDQSKYRETISRATETPRGYGPQGVVRSSFSLMEWMERPEVEKAWNEVKEKHGLKVDPVKDRVQIFGLTDSAVISCWPLSLSMRKARKMGFHGSVDSYEAAFHCLKDMANLKISAPLATDEFIEQ